MDSGRLERELRRGVDKADIWGVSFAFGRDAGWAGRTGPGGAGGKEDHEVSKKEERSLIVGWSDKGTMHLWGDESYAGTDDTTNESGQGNKVKPKKTKVQKLGALLDPHVTLPNYFRSQPSFALFRLSRQVSASLHTFAATADANKDSGGDLGLNERFVVAWIDIEEAATDQGSKTSGLGTRGAADLAGRPGLIRLGSGASKASRGHGSRRGSGSTIDSPSDRATRRRSLREQYGAPPSPGPTTSKAAATAASGKTLSETERKTDKVQLVAITYSGEWLRIGLPEPDAANEGEDKGQTDNANAKAKAATEAARADRCKLLEYRKMSTAIGGW